MRLRSLLRYGACLVPIAGCETKYQAAATPCDEWCLVTQRAGCEDDWPDNCVRDCAERGSNAVAESCPGEWGALIDCHRATPDTEYYCAAEESRARESVCEPERKSTYRCASPDMAGCFELCDQGQAWSLSEGIECYNDCLRLERVCGATAAGYFACASGQGGPIVSANGGCYELSLEFSECLQRHDIDVFEGDDDVGP